MWLVDRHEPLFFPAFVDDHDDMERPYPLDGEDQLLDLVVVELMLLDHLGVLEDAEVIEEVELDDDQVKELVLTVEWVRPLHVVVVVDEGREEDRIVTLYDPDDDRWTDGYRRRR